LSKVTSARRRVIEVAGNVVEHGRPPGKVQWSFHLEVRP
jgi:hypothetical protein